MQNISIILIDYVSDSKCGVVDVIIGNYDWRRDGECNEQWIKSLANIIMEEVMYEFMQSL